MGGESAEGRVGDKLVGGRGARGRGRFKEGVHANMKGRSKPKEKVVLPFIQLVEDFSKSIELSFTEDALLKHISNFNLNLVKFGHVRAQVRN